MSFVVTVLVLAVVSVDGLSSERLHELMNEDELEYYFRGEPQEKVYEIVYLPTMVFEREAAGTSESGNDLDYEFSAFGSPISLKLKRNSKLIPDNFKSYAVRDNYRKTLPRPRDDCHYVHREGDSAGAISTCVPRQMHGILFMKNHTLEILPLTERLETVLRVREPLLAYETGFDDRVPHIVRRVNDQIYHDDTLGTRSYIREPLEDKAKYQWSRAGHRPVGGMTVELALFFDEAAYKIFAPYMNYDEAKLQDMILAYVNGVQALYHHPSLGATLELVLVRLDIMKKQPGDMPHYNGERGKLLDSFCEYQNRINPKSDDNPDHWDMALYVSGLDFFAYENGRQSGVTMGLATVGGVCLGQYACLIAEFGTTNVFGKPYPSAGFTSVHILAHEIGHNLGMHHDGTGNSCPKEGYIMSPSRGTNGETQWSTCSASVMAQLSSASCLYDFNAVSSPERDHKKFSDIPGQVYTVKRQCEVLLRDKDATISPSQDLSTICYNLQCKTPHRSGYYHAGPALEGTQCGKGKYCFGGDCIDRTPPKGVDITPGGWSPWKTGTCSSGCILKSRGFQEKRRSCNNPNPVNTDRGCEGSSYEVGLCNDDSVCQKQIRKTSTEYATAKCKEFSKLLPQLDPKGAGLQAPHEPGRMWMGCAIFCRRSDTGAFYTPRIELNDLGVSPYFPDGTLCHSDSTGKYFCLRHHCLPENFHLTKAFLPHLGDDIPISQNAHPTDVISGGLMNYLSLGADGKPLQTTLRPGDAKPPNEEDWETDDYVELPVHLNKVASEGVVDELNILDFVQ